MQNTLPTTKLKSKDIVFAVRSK